MKAKAIIISIALFILVSKSTFSQVWTFEGDSTVTFEDKQAFLIQSDFEPHLIDLSHIGKVNNFLVMHGNPNCVASGFLHHEVVEEGQQYTLRVTGYSRELTQAALFIGEYPGKGLLQIGGILPHYQVGIQSIHFTVPKGISEVYIGVLILNPQSTGDMVFVKKMEWIKNDVAECPICLEDVYHISDNFTLASCSHTFHDDCLDAWKAITPNCPVCRSKIGISQ